MRSTIQKSEEKHNAIEKALAILGLFAIDNQDLGTIEISKLLGYHKATTSRTLILLAEYGYLEQTENSKKYRLGQRIVNLGLALTRSLKRDLVQIAKPYLEELRNSIQETIVFEVELGKNKITAYIADGPSNIRLGGQVGEAMPFSTTAGSKAILAFKSVDEWENFLDEDLPRQTANSITDKSLFRHHLEEVKRTGIATDKGENDPDLFAVSAPVFNIERLPVAAVDAVGLANRIDISADGPVAQAVKSTAEMISKRLYHSKTKATSMEDWLESIKIPN